jgi:hypothetical protein
MTPQDPLERAPASAYRAEFVDRIDRILAARRMKPALPTQELPQCSPVDDYKSNKQSTQHEVIILRADAGV